MPDTTTPHPEARLAIGIGIEGTFAPQSGRDTLEATGHYRGDRWRRDLELVRTLGVTEVRYPVPWHRIERVRGAYDWAFMDGVIEHATVELGLSVIADPLHHTSYPAWMADGFLNPAFATAYPAFVEAFARRYPAVTAYAPFNEPTCTLDFSSARGFWYPYATGDASYVAALMSTAAATAEAIRRLRRINPATRIIHVDTFEHHDALDDASRGRAEFLNDRRFLFEELIRGVVTPDHGLAGYLRANGATDAQLAGFREAPVTLDARFGNYYPLNEEQLQDGLTHAAPSREPIGLARVIAQYAARVPYPLSLGETNIQGSVYDRISWLKYVLEQIELAQEEYGVPIREFAWYPLFDCAGWRPLLQGDDWPRDPQGIFWCDAGWDRHESELSDIYASVARGMPSRDIPAYALAPEHDAALGPLMSRMTHWDWRDPPDPTLGR